ncbi:MAG: phage portal protein [Lachnospiraceae bacterium]|nr:phage portal protein [Lachnospiraceae bacterium]
MEFLDNVISQISPSWGYKRMAWRMGLDELRNYDAGDASRINQGWRVVNDSAERTDRYQRDIVRARARDLERNSDLMNSVVSPFKRNTIGSGYLLQAHTGNDDLNKKIEKLWKKWCKARNCDVTGTQTLNEILRMSVTRKKIDGGILFLKRYTRDGIIPFQLQMVEVDELDLSQFGPHNKNARVVGGIEYNRYNKPIGYWIKQYDIDGYNMDLPVYIDAKDVIFYYTKRRPSQIREMSDMSQTVTRVRDVNEFINAVSVKQRIEACLSVFIKRTFPQGGLGRALNGPGDGGAQKNYDGKMLTPGMIRELNAGDDVVTVNPLGQAADAAGFVKLQQRIMSSGQGLSYESTSRDMSESNYSSARQGIIEDEATYAEEEEKLLAVIDEIYETFLISAILCGALNIPGFWEDKDTYFDHEWNRAPKKWIDPAKESNATKIALQTGQKTFKQIAAENGKDWRTQIDDMAEVQDYGAEKGLNMQTIIFGQAKQIPEEPAEKEKDGKEG